MPILTPSLPFDPDSVKLSEQAEAAANMRFEVDEDHWAEVIACGTWWVLPFARLDAGRELLGIRIIPGEALQRCPVVYLKRFEVMTRASSLAYLLPAQILAGALIDLQSWEQLRSVDEKIWSELKVLHATFGGTDDLSAIRTVLEDNALRDAVLSRRDLEARGRVASLIDPEAETRRFREYVTKAIVSGDAPVPVPEFGCWNAWGAATAFVTNTQWNVKRHQASLEAAWCLAQQPVGLDCFQGSSPGHAFAPHGASPNGVPLRAAKYLIEHGSEVSTDWQQDPIWPALRATATGDRHAAALAYMDAASLLKERGNAARAFYALTSAAYWMWVGTEQAFPQLIHGATLFASEAGWLETVEALGAVAERTRDALTST